MITVNDWSGSCSRRKEYKGGGCPTSPKPVILRPDAPEPIEKLVVVPSSAKLKTKIVIPAGSKVLIRKMGIGKFKKHTMRITKEYPYPIEYFGESFIFYEGEWQIMCYKSVAKVVSVGDL